MKKSLRFIILGLPLMSGLLLGACSLGRSQTQTFSDAENEKEDISGNYQDSLSASKINITNTYKLNDEFKVTYKTLEPSGEGSADFKAKVFKEIEKAGNVLPEEGKKLFLLELAVKGNPKNKGMPSTFNQVGDNPSPQFVLIDKSQNRSFVEDTYFSDSYTQSKKLFELSKITTDQSDWVNTAIVFQVDKNSSPDLAFRFTNQKGEVEFYDIQ